MSSESQTQAMSQEDIVLTLVQGEEGLAWAQSRIGWDSESVESVCKWDGITCGAHDKVVGIRLVDGDLSATVPSELGLLDGLVHLEMKGESIKGSIPFEIANLISLEIIQFSDSIMHGKIPLFSSSNLKELKLNNNNFEGTLPFLVGKSKEYLVYFDVSGNNITGTIPSSIGEAFNLEYLDMSGNRFQGSLPEELGNLQHLEMLILNDNELIGKIPPAISHIQNLEQLFLFGNDFSGTIPAALGDLSFLIQVFVDGNKFTGSIPQEVCDRNFNDQWFSGHPSGIGRDGCTSIACPVNTEAQHQGVYPCTPCGESFMNPYLGSNKCVNLNQKEILKSIYTDTKGGQWNGARSWKLANDAGWGDNINECDLEGVQCNGSGHVISISLKNTNLGGTIPASIGFLRYLRILDLSDNAITGYVPSDLRWPPLEDLDLSGNKLTGFVPPMLCEESGINSNGKEGHFSCDNLVCPSGTFNPIGRATVKQSGQEFTCMKCFDEEQASFLGQKTCDNKSMGALTLPDSSNSKGSSNLLLLTIMIPVLIVVIVLAVWGYRKYRKLATTRRTEYYSSNGVTSKSVLVDYCAKQPSSIFNNDKVKRRNDKPHSLSFDISTERQSDREVWLDVPRGQLT